MKHKIVVIGFASLLIGWSTRVYPIPHVINVHHPNEVLTSSLGQQYSNVKWSVEEFVRQDTVVSKKARRRIRKQERKIKTKDLKFNLGDGVTVTTGPMKGMYGVIIYHDKKMKYLIRFTGTQQMFFDEDEIKLWDQ